MATSYNRRRISSGTRAANRRRATSRSGGYGRSYSSRIKSGMSSGSFTTIRNELECKINALQCLYATTKSPNARWSPSPAQISKFANLVNKGANIHKVTGRQIAKWSKSYSNVTTPTTAMKALKYRFGAAVKGVTFGPSSGNFLVATASTIKGKPFKFPK
jgi:hypothetical protein